MSKIKGLNTKPELLVRKFLHSKGLRYRLHDNKLPGRPDLVLPKYSAVILVHGCFWHGHKNCKYFVIPKTRTSWWTNKIENNVKRDVKVISELKKIGYDVIVIWECELKHKLISETLDKVLQLLKSNQPNKKELKINA